MIDCEKKERKLKPNERVSPPVVDIVSVMMDPNQRSLLAVTLFLSSPALFLKLHSGMEDKAQQTTIEEDIRDLEKTEEVGVHSISWLAVATAARPRNCEAAD